MVRVRGRDASSRGGCPFALGAEPGRGVRGLETDGGRVVGTVGGGEGAEFVDHERSRVRKACSGVQVRGGHGQGEKRKEREESHGF